MKDKRSGSRVDRPIISGLVVQLSAAPCSMSKGLKKVQRACHLCYLLFTHFNFRSKFEATAHKLHLLSAQGRGAGPICVSARYSRWHGRTRIFTQGWGRAYASSSDERGEGGLKGRLSEKTCVLKAIYIPPGQLKPLSFKPAPMLGDFMPVLLHLPDIWSQSIKPLCSLKALKCVSEKCFNFLYQTSSLCSGIGEQKGSIFLALPVFGLHGRWPW